MIEAENVTRTFGRKTALSDVGFRILPGETVLLAGPNGAGKTTLLRVLSGYAPATSGIVRIAGYDLFEDAEAARSMLGYVPENIPLYQDMRVSEYLRFRGSLRHLARRSLRRRMEALIERFDLGPLRRALIGDLARGQRARVALADALLHEPTVLLLDEPLASLDAEQRQQFLSLLQEVRQHTAVLLATHFPDEGAHLFNRVLLLRQGHLLRNEARETSASGLQAQIAGWLSEAAQQPPPGTMGGGR